MIAEVIPYRKTIRGKDYFDYAIPEDCTVTEGSLVLIPFRSSTLLGIVRKIKATSNAQRLKSISTVVPDTSWKTAERMALLEWFAAYYCVSLPHSFKLFQEEYLQRPRTIPLNIQLSQGTVESKPIHIKKGHVHVIHYSHMDDRGPLYSSIASETSNHVLIIIPEHSEASRLISALSISRYLLIESNPAPSTIASIKKTLTEETDQIVVVATRKTALLILHLCPTIILDQEESKSHKQYDLNPRYHTRSVLLQARALAPKTTQSTIILASHAPTAYTYQHAQDDGYEWLDKQRPWNRDNSTLIDMETEKIGNNYSWFSSELLKRTANAKKTLLLFNRTGEFGTSLCTDCATLLASGATSCSSCKGSNIRRTRKGTKALEEELHTAFQHKKILRVDREQDLDNIEQRIADADIIVATEKIFRLTPMSLFDLIGIVSIDHQLTYPHFRAHERTFQFLFKVLGSGITNIVQTHAPHHPVIRAAVEGNYNAFITDELTIRMMMGLPPFKDRYTLIDTNSKKVEIVESIPTTLPSSIVVDREE